MGLPSDEGIAENEIDHENTLLSLECVWWKNAQAKNPQGYKETLPTYRDWQGEASPSRDQPLGCPFVEEATP